MSNFPMLTPPPVNFTVFLELVTHYATALPSSSLARCSSTDGVVMCYKDQVNSICDVTELLLSKLRASPVKTIVSDELDHNIKEVRNTLKTPMDVVLNVPDYWSVMNVVQQSMPICNTCLGNDTSSVKWVEEEITNCKQYTCIKANNLYLLSEVFSSYYAVLMTWHIQNSQ